MKTISFFIFMLLIPCVSCTRQAAKGLAVKSVSLEVKDIFNIRIIKKDIILEGPHNYLFYVKIKGRNKEQTVVDGAYCVCVRKKMKFGNMFVTRMQQCNLETIEKDKTACRYPNDIDKDRARRLGISVERDLFELALRGDSDGIVRALSTGDIDINRRYRFGNFGLYTALHGAVLNNHEGLVSLILKKGAEIDVSDHYGNTPLNLSGINYFMVKNLVGRGANIDFKNNRNETAIFRFTREGRKDLVVFLMEKGAGIFYKNEFSENLLNVLVDSFFNGKWSRVDFLKMLDIFLKRGITPNNRSNGLVGRKDYPVILATQKNDFEMLAAMLNGKADLNVMSNYGKTPLMIALGNHDKRVVRFLVENGADVNLGDKEGKNALLLAIPDLEMVKYLLDKGFKLNYANVNGILKRAEDLQVRTVYEFLKKKAEAILKESEGAMFKHGSK